MSPKHTQVYEKLRDEFRLQLENDEEMAIARIGTITKLSQVVSGYFLIPGSETESRIMPPDLNPKLNVLRSELESCIEANEKIIVWARFHVELADIAEMLRRMEIPFVTYHGKTPDAERKVAVDEFQKGSARVFLSQQAAGGVGITLVASSTVIYYSNTFSLTDRVQSEDRSHRIGQEKNCRYVDIIAVNSIDMQIIQALKNKIDVAALITGDAQRAAKELLNFQ